MTQQRNKRRYKGYNATVCVYTPLEHTKEYTLCRVGGRRAGLNEALFTLSDDNKRSSRKNQGPYTAYVYIHTQPTALICKVNRA